MNAAQGYDESLRSKESVIGEIIRIEHLKKEYPGATPLSDVNLRVCEGEVIAVIGPSGTGKSTLIRLINRMETPTAGKIFFRGDEITAPGYRTNLLRQKIGMIFQYFNLFPHMTVIENIMAAPVALKGLSKQDAYDKAKELLASVGLPDKAFSYPDDLSGGQQQRIAIVRALAMEPEMLLMDEPISALDPAMKGEVEAVIRRLAESGATMMIVTHDMGFARRIASRVLYMDEGVVYEDGTPEEIFGAPKRERTRKFILRLKTLKILIESQDFDFIGCHTLIAAFGMKNNVPRGITYSLMLLFEEICTQLLLPRLPAPKIRWTAEYYPESEYAKLMIDYNGEPWNIEESENELSLQIVRGRTDEIRYRAESDGEFSNHLDITIMNR